MFAFYGKSCRKLVAAEFNKIFRAITKSINTTAAVLIVLLVLMIYVLILIPFVQLRSTKEFYFKKDEFAIKSR